MKLHFFIVMLFIVTQSLAQEESINTDRPDQSDGVYTLTKNKLQIEEGITTGENYFVNNLMLRYGITRFTEIRLLADAGKIGDLKGLLPLTMSVKQKIMEQKKWLPALTFVGYVSFQKLAAKEFRGNKIPYELKLAFENELNEKFTISYNAGVSDEFEKFNYTFNIGYSPLNKVSVFAEYFATTTKSDTQHNADAGILFLIHPKFQIDIACGHSIADSESRFLLPLDYPICFKNQIKCYLKNLYY